MRGGSTVDRGVVSIDAGLELVVSTDDARTLYADGAALAYARECGHHDVTLGGLLAEMDRSEVESVMAWIAAAIDGATAIRLLSPDGGTIEASISMHGLRSDPNERVRVVSLRIRPSDTEPTSTSGSMPPLDAVTGLPGRSTLLDALDRALADPNVLSAVMYVDVDDFKRLNDTRGHHAGDQLLAQVADRLRLAAPEGVVARFGSDEFVVLLPSTDLDRLELCIRDVLAVTDRPFRLGTADVPMSASVGVAVASPGDVARHTDRLVREADLALLEAKRLGRGGVRHFTDRLRRQYAERVEVEEALRLALERRELYLEYQPQISLVTGRVVSVEALARWRGPDGRNVPPDRFIPVAEETGLIVELGRWVLDAACQQQAQWRASLEAPPALIAVNVSPRQLNDEGFVGDVEATLRRHGIPPTSLCLELTESGFEGLADELEGLHQLRDLGCFIGIDDFGTGYSSLARLRDLPVEILKIDRRFVNGLGVDHDDTAIVSAIMGLALTLGLHVIAEGVERDEQAAALNRLGCPVAQGYLFARPELPSTLREKLTRHSIWTPTGDGSAADTASFGTGPPRRAHRAFSDGARGAGSTGDADYRRRS